MILSILLMRQLDALQTEGKRCQRLWCVRMYYLPCSSHDMIGYGLWWNIKRALRTCISKFIRIHEEMDIVSIGKDIECKCRRQLTFLASIYIFNMYWTFIIVREFRVLVHKWFAFNSLIRIVYFITNGKVKNVIHYSGN